MYVASASLMLIALVFFGTTLPEPPPPKSPPLAYSPMSAIERIFFAFNGLTQHTEHSGSTLGFLSGANYTWISKRAYG
eukprot:m.864973 g.864973  ORF g.864973 m.864973 type:complete len:78 (+) comp23547_c0_seq33:4440-4673(+)